MLMRITFILSFSTTLLYSFRSDMDPSVRIPNGKLVGVNLVSRKGRVFSAFRGIPYAKPPLGELRFKEPQEVDGWNSTFFATKNPPKCAQKNYLFGDQSVEGDEDCLYLNVYTPFSNTRGNSLLPVMVFIHWGGFFTGYSGSDYLGPEYLMDADVILVTFNYRLGILGFFSTNDDESPGNFGLKDQTLALKWVAKNIKHFGGDKNKVTLFGQSAGGASVHYHILSPGSKGLFQNAISESGTALALWAQPFNGSSVNLPLIQAKMVGCPNVSNSQEIVKCLREQNVQTLIESGDKFKFFSIDPLSIYLPTIEEKTEKNPNPFITKHPVNYIKSQDYTKVPWIIGQVSDEGLIRASPLFSQLKLWKTLTAKFNELMPKMLVLNLSTPPSKLEQVWSKIRKFYFGKNSTKQQILRGLIDLYTDRAFHYSIYQTTLLHSLYKHEPIWFYNFDYRGEYSYQTIFSGVNETSASYTHGASHCDELLYLFKSPSLFNELRNKNDQKMIDKMLELWTNFAIHSDPTRLNEGAFEWNPITRWNYTASKSLNFLNINGSFEESINFSMENGLYNRRTQFWEELPLAENLEDLKQNHQDL